MRACLRRAVWICPILIAWLSALQAVEPRNWDVFQQRRRDLAAKRPEGAIVLFGVNEEQGRLGPGPLVQESNFFYLTGCREPDAVLLIEPAVEDRPYRETLFLAKSSGVEQEWKGRRIDPEDDSAAAKMGFAQVRGAEALERSLRSAVKRYGRLYSLLGEGPKVFGRPAASGAPEKLAGLGVETEPYNVRSTLAEMRLIKSDVEVRAIERAVEATVYAHLEAWRALRVGIPEYAVFAAMSRGMILHGALRPAYPPIIASGANATTLHYVELMRTIEPGELVLMDVGGEVGGYAADLTRTVPASGRFTDRQRQVYEWVLEAQNLAIAAARPGARLAGPGSLTELAEELFDSKEPGLARRFRHSIGHFVGLDVHDPSPLSTTLAAGMVITIEPGLYLPDEDMGVRIEDMLLITEDGARLLSEALPRESWKIEQFMGINAGH